VSTALQVAYLIDFLSEQAGTQVGLLADGVPVEPTDYVGSHVLNKVLSVTVDGVEAIKANDGCHLLPYYTQLEKWDYQMTVPIDTAEEWKETVFHTEEDGVLLVSTWHDPDQPASVELLAAVEEMADEYRDVVFATVDVIANKEAADAETAYWNVREPPALILFKDGIVAASMDGSDATEDALRDAINAHRPDLEE